MINSLASHENHGSASPVHDKLEEVTKQRDELRAALEAAIDCGMVPTSTAKDGGAPRHARQVIVADMIRDAIASVKEK